MMVLPDQHPHPQRREHGQAMVEFALVMPILFGLIFCVLQFGWTYVQYQQVGFAATEGARCAAVANNGNRPACAYDATTPAEAARSRAIAKSPSLDLTSANVDVGFPMANTVRVTVSKDVDVPVLSWPMFEPFFDDTTFTLRTSSTARMQR